MQPCALSQSLLALHATQVPALHAGVAVRCEHWALVVHGWQVCVADAHADAAAAEQSASARQATQVPLAVSHCMGAVHAGLQPVVLASG